MEKSILTRLQQTFADWQSPSSKRRYSNAGLREQAVKCLARHTYQEVSDAVGISVTTLRSWEKSLRRNKEVVESNPAFVAMNLNHLPTLDEAKYESPTLQISLPTGITIQVTSSSIKSSVALIVALNKEVLPCST